MDPDAKLYRKARGQESRLCYMGHALMENRHGLVVDGLVTPANGTAERTATLAMLDRRPNTRRRITLGADKAYDAMAFVSELKARSVTPHIAINATVSKHGVVRSTAVDRRTTRHTGYAISQTIRKGIEEVFGWSKSIGGLAHVKLRGLAKVEAVFTLGLAAYNLIRLPKILEAGT